MSELEGVYAGNDGLGAALTRTRFRLQRWLSRPEKIMGLVLLAVLAILVVLPLVQIVIGASTFGPNDVRLVPGSTPGAWTIYHWQRIAASPLTQVLLVKHAVA